MTIVHLSQCVTDSVLPCYFRSNQERADADVYLFFEIPLSLHPWFTVEMLLILVFVLGFIGVRYDH